MPPRGRKRTVPSGPTPVESIKHGDKRSNLPTADAQEFVTPEIEQARKIVVERDVTLDPQLVWKGKYGDETAAAIEGAIELSADAPPIYIQEKIDPRALVENLRKTAKAGDAEPEYTLFDTFDGLDALDLVEFYEHQANWSNRMILGDSLQVMASLAEREDLRGTVQMIYIDPPYGISFGSNWQASARKRDVEDGKIDKRTGEIRDLSREAEQIKAFRDTWALGIHSYLVYLRDRLLAARELLAGSGSCFVQMGDQNVHLVRSLMDEVFGAENFCAQIAFAKTTSSSSDILASVFDYLLWYSPNAKSVKYRPLFESRKPIENPNERYVCVETSDGSIVDLSKAQKEGREPIPEGRFLRLDNPTSQDPPSSPQPFEFNGRVLYPPPKRHWSVKWPEGMERVRTAGLFFLVGNTLVWKNYRDFASFKPVNNIWTSLKPSGFGEGNIYVVQTISEVVERCVLMTTDPGDLVLDPTCGSGTTAYVAEQWGRRWITIDTSRVALALARQRLMGARFPYYLKSDSVKGRAKQAEITGQPQPTGTPTDDIRHGFVYERFQHITLKSIADTPEIKEGMSRAEIDAAIKRHAEYELLYDRPYEDKNTVRVSGPFTVESLSPHRSLAFAGGPDEESRESISERRGAEQPDAATFEQSILDNLAKAGVQNGRRGERIEFESLEPYAGNYVQAVGVQRDSDGTRIGIAIGPQYGTVSQRFARDAVKEAIDARDIELLCVLGFAFDATTTEVTERDGVTVDASRDGFANVAGERAFGKIKLLLVRMNVDLLMGDELKKTGSGNLFTVFGEPDITLNQQGGEVVVHLNGVDVYDPTTGEVRSNDTSQIALWMIDTDYDGDSFFVRHCYFTGGGDPYKRLRTALKAEIDEDGWASLYSTTSRPFPKPGTGRIAVKVINDYGDEVMKIFDVN